jgi:hypothetical protein
MEPALSLSEETEEPDSGNLRDGTRGKAMKGHGSSTVPGLLFPERNTVYAASQRDRRKTHRP